MRVTISSSSCDDIDGIYKESAIKVCDYLASKGFDLNWGSGSSSIMGICYNEFNKYNRKIYGYTTPLYVSDLVNLPNATHVIYDTTFDLKKNIFNDSNLVVILPGGTGSVSEFFAYLEEIRSNSINKELILYNEFNHFDTTIALIDDLIKRKFNKDTIYNFYKVANSFDEFKNIIENICSK